MDSGDAQTENREPELPEDVPTIYKKSSFDVGTRSRSGLDPGMNVVDGILQQTSKQEVQAPIHGVLHVHKDGEPEEHPHHHVVLLEAEPTEATEPEPAPKRPSKVSEPPIVAPSVPMTIDPKMEQEHAKRHRKVHVNKTALKTIHAMYPKGGKKQELLLEAILAAQHVRELTTRYGSKNKNVRQYFLEAVDADTRLAVFGDEKAGLEEAQRGLKRLDGPRKGQQGETASMMTLTEDDTAYPINLTDSSITLPTDRDDLPQEDVTPSLVGVWSKENFWASLEKLEWEQEPESAGCKEGKGNPLYEIYGPKWKRSKRFAQQGETFTKKTSLVKYDLENFPDKYLEPGVQEVQQSEAVRRLWAQVNSQLELFSGWDPIAYEMFGGLYDEVRDFVKLPEEDIIDFNNGLWEPEPLDEKRILYMEPYEKLMTRFSVYQKAFCFMAQHFDLLTPIFAEIKQAYEDVFEKGERETKEVEKDQMEELELRKALARHVRMTDRKGHRLLLQVKAEAHVLQEHLQWQHHTLHTILGMLWKIRSSLKLTSWAVTQLKHMHRSKVEALAKEIVSTQGQMLFDMALPGKYTEIMKRIRDQSDPKEIRRILLAVRRQLRAAHKKIVMFEADYADTVPKTEFETVQKKFSIISKRNEAVQEALNVLKSERQLRKQAIAGLKSEIYETSGLVKDLRRKPTPRPSWTSISRDWPAGESKFGELRDGNSTRQVINKMVEELRGKKVGEMTVYIQPKGTGENVPIYLRYDKPLLKRNFTAAEAALFIKDIWKRRVDVVSVYRKIKLARKDEEDGVASYPDDLPYELPSVKTFPEFVSDYFRSRCHLEQMRMEWVYNLVECCKAYSSVETYLAQFQGTLEGSIDESIYHLFHVELERLQKFMYAKADESAAHKGYLEWPDVIKYLTDLCPTKAEEQINAVNNLGSIAYGIRGTWTIVRAQTLFEGDDDGKESEFVKLMYKQFEDDRMVFLRDIYMEILTELGISEKLLDHADDPVWQTDVSMHMFYACVISIDPTVPEQTLISYLAWIYLRVTALPGVTTLGTRLLDFLKDRAQLSQAELEKYNEDEDVEFESCIREIRDYEEDESTMDKLDLKKRRLATKKLRYASLRQVMDGLYSGPFVRFGIRVEKAKVEVEPEVVEVKEEKRHHKHKHHHKKHKHGKNQDGEDYEMDDVFIS